MIATHDVNVALVELVAYELGPLRDELVLVGGCSVGLLITDQARPPVRQTIDVDLIAEVVSVPDYYKLSERLQAHGFSQSQDAEHMCRWTKGELMVDILPSSEGSLGHSTNRWYKYAAENSQQITLPSGVGIQVVTAPLFIATKLEAFHGRGNGDYCHHDMEDIINVIDGRPSLADEVTASPEDVRIYIRDEIDDLLADIAFVDSLPSHMRPDAANQARVSIVLERLKKLAGL